MAAGRAGDMMELMSERRFAVGLDYGTSSVRALVVDVETGEEVGTGVYGYRHGVEGVVVDARDPHLARQHPLDYLEGALAAMGSALGEADGVAGFSRGLVVGVGVDTTGSTPIPVDGRGVPLAMTEKHRDDPAGMAWLWKDHTAIEEAEAISSAAGAERFLAKCGGVYSSEWFWAKAWRCARVAPEVFADAASWVELCDFVPAWLVGSPEPGGMYRSSCAAGHKAMWSLDWGGLPQADFWDGLSPELGGLRRRLYERVSPIGTKVGDLMPELAKALGLGEGVAVSAGAFDAHLGAVACGVREGMLVKIMGTSTCDITVGRMDGSVGDVPGICGVAEDSVLPGYLGLEAGQSAVGDLFAWSARFAGSELEEVLAGAASLRPGESGLLALDWHNGNRTVLVDQALSGLLVGQSLSTTAVEAARAAVEATAFGARRIVEQFESHGVRVEEVVCCGGIAEKSRFVMQVYADVLGRRLRVARSGQTCALGAAMAGAVASGALSGFGEASERMVGFRDEVYEPEAGARAVYERLYGLYLRLHDAFGVSGSGADVYPVMKELLSIRREARG